MKLRKNMKKVVTLFWVSIFWTMAVGIFMFINWGLYTGLTPNAPLWVYAVAAGVVDIIYLWSAFDALMAFTYDMLYPGMDEER